MGSWNLWGKDKHGFPACYAYAIPTDDRKEIQEKAESSGWTSLTWARIHSDYYEEAGDDSVPVRHPRKNKAHRGGGASARSDGEADSP